MKKFFFKLLLIIDILAFIIYAACATFIARYDTLSGITTDGFGRVLTKAPLFFYSQGIMEKGAGLGWFVVDTICSLSLIAIAYLLFGKITENRSK